MFSITSGSDSLFRKDSTINRLLRHLLDLDRAYMQIVIELALERFALRIHALGNLRNFVSVGLSKLVNLIVKMDTENDMFPNVALRHVLYTDLARETVFYSIMTAHTSRTVLTNDNGMAVVDGCGDHLQLRGFL